MFGYSKIVAKEHLKFKVKVFHKVKIAKKRKTRQILDNI